MDKDREQHDKEVLEAGQAIKRLLEHESEEVRKDAEKILQAFQHVIEKVENRKKEEEGLPIDPPYVRWSPVTHIYRLNSMLQDLERNYKQARQDLQYYEKITQDVLHALELASNEFHEENLINYMRELQQIRIQRRKAKNFIELATPFFDILGKYPQLRKEIREAQATTKRIENQQITRTYEPREKTAMKFAFERVLKNKLEEVAEKE